MLLSSDARLPLSQAESNADCVCLLLQGEFDWDEEAQATVLNAFFFGYLITQIPGGYLAERFSVTWVFGLGIGLTALFTMFTAIAARWGFYVFIALRVLEGISEVPMY